jgi:hypothetical protein
MTTTKIDNAFMAKTGLSLKHLILVSDLGLYGFTADIIELMKHFEIFPDTFIWRKKVYVLRNQVFGIVEHFLHNSMKLYRDSEVYEKAQEDLAEMLENDAVKLDPETLEPIIEPVAEVISAEGTIALESFDDSLESN